MASLDDVITVAKNIVTAINGASQAYISVNGQQTSGNIASSSQIQTVPGRLATVSITAATGGNPGMIYDTNTGTATNPVFAIPDTLGIVFVNLRIKSGIYVELGTGMEVAVTFSRDQFGP